MRGLALCALHIGPKGSRQRGDGNLRHSGSSDQFRAGRLADCTGHPDPL